LSYIILSILLFSFNNVLWKKNLKGVNTFFLISFRGFVNCVVGLFLAFLFLKSFPNSNDFLKITLGSILGVTGLICMLTVIKKHALQWLGIYNLLGVLITYLHLYVFENFTKTPSLSGLFFIILGYVSYIVFNYKKTKRLNLKAHGLLLLIIICFSYASIIHWKNLTNNIPPIFIIVNQELVVFIVSFSLLFLKSKKEISLGNYKMNFIKVLIMSVLVIVAMYFSFIGIKITDPFLAALLFLASPLTTILFAAIFLKEKISFYDTLSILSICLGAFLIHLQTK
jgi:drug/metabolite transporter (DMT)-like permease